MYKIDIKTSEKIFLVTLEGMLSAKETQEHLNEILIKVKSIKPQEYVFVINLTNIKPTYQNVVPDIEKSIETCLTLHFKGYYSILPKNVIAASQDKRAKQNTGMFDKFTNVNSLEEIFEKYLR